MRAGSDDKMSQGFGSACDVVNKKRAALGKPLKLPGASWDRDLVVQNRETG